MRRLDDTTVVFDLDGTLVDTAPDLAGAANGVLTEIGRPSLPVEALRPYVGQGARATLRHALEVTGGGVDEATLNGLVDRFLVVYTGRISAHSRPFPGALAALDALAAAGAVLGICTNKREAPARQLLDELGLLPRFAAVVGGDTCPTRKPEPESLAETLRRAGGRAYGVMIGDTTADTGAANALGIPSIGVSFGYSPLPASEIGATRVIDHFDDLIPAIDAVLADVGRVA